MSIDVTKYETDDPRWTDALATLPHDVYHLPGFVRSLAEHAGGHPQLWHAVDRATGTAMAIPLVVRSLALDDPGDGGDRGQVRDAASPYGYASPLVGTGADAARVRPILSAILDDVAAAGIVSLFLRSHPLLPFDPSWFDGRGTVVEHGTTIAVPLDADQECMWRRVRRRYRPDINGLIRDGFVVDRTDGDGIDRFHALYVDHMERLDADAAYFFTREHLHALHDRCHDAFELYEVRSPHGETACAGVFFRYGRIGAYHLSATRHDFVDASPAKLLMWCVMRSMAERGASHLHLGGGLGGREDTLHRFKLGFSKRTYPFFTVRLVLDQLAYDDACRAVGHDASPPLHAYFPAYRAPRGSTTG